MPDNKKALTISVPAELFAALTDLRKNQSVNISAFCTHAIYAALEAELQQNQPAEYPIRARNFGRGIISDKPLLENDPRVLR
jgi:hypothetical protein